MNLGEIIHIKTILDNIYKIEDTGQSIMISLEDIRYIKRIEEREDREAIAFIYPKNQELYYKVRWSDLNRKLKNLYTPKYTTYEIKEAMKKADL